MEVKYENEQGMTIEIPAYRVDVQRPCDVVEDILRIYGYNNVEIPTQLKSSLVIKGDEDRKHKLANLVSEQLVGEGFNEILNSSLTKAAYYGDKQDTLVHIMNPLSSDLNVMRQTLLYGGLESIQHNVNRKRQNLRFFEFGNVYTFDPEKKNDDDPMQAYKEQNHAALWVTGKRVEGSWAHKNEDSTFYELSAYVENILRRIGLKPGMTVRKKSENDIFSSGLTIENRGGKKLVEMGIITKKLQKQFGLDNPVYYAEMNWTALMKVTKKNEVLYTEISKFPAVSRDLALLVDNSVEFAQIEQIARQTEKKLLKKVELFDVYEGDKLPAGKNMTTPYCVDLPALKGINIVQSDEFNVWKPKKSKSRFGSWKAGLKLCWQWNHIPDNNGWSLTDRKGWLRLKTTSVVHNIRDARNSLTQRAFGPTCTGEVLLDASGLKDGDVAGLSAFQNRYGFVGVKRENGKLFIVMHRAMEKGDADGKEITRIPLTQNQVYLRTTMDFTDRTDKATFFYSPDGYQWQPIGDTLQMHYDWPDFCGYLFALFHYATKEVGGKADFDWFHVKQ